MSSNIIHEKVIEISNLLVDIKEIAPSEVFPPLAEVFKALGDFSYAMGTLELEKMKKGKN